MGLPSKKKKKETQAEKFNVNIASVWENETDKGDTYFNLSVNQPFKRKDGSQGGGRLLFEDAETGDLFEVKRAQMFDTANSKFKRPENLVMDVVIDLNNEDHVDLLPED